MGAPFKIEHAIAMIDDFDPTTFAVDSSTSVADKTSLLRIQAMIRKSRPAYKLLEIGSYLGGTLFPHLIDPACKTILSIDIRPETQPDERARHFSYAGVTTDMMMGRLRAEAPDADYGKLRTFDGDASKLPRPGRLYRGFDLAMIDGEHTNVATFRDFVSIYPHLTRNAVVIFHDTNLIIDAIKNIEQMLDLLGIQHSLFLLPDVVGALALGGSIAEARAAFAPIALEEGDFIRNSKRRLREEIAQAVAEGAHLAG